MHATSYTLHPGTHPVRGHPHHIGVLIPAADGQQDLTNLHAGAHTLGLAEGTAHTGLQPAGGKAQCSTATRSAQIPLDSGNTTDASGESKTTPAACAPCQCLQVPALADANFHPINSAHDQRPQLASKQEQTSTHAADAQHYPCAGPSKHPQPLSHPPISTGARQHLVDAQHVEGVHTHAQVEGFLSGVLGHVLVGSNTGSFQSLRGDVLLLPTAAAAAEQRCVTTGRM